MISPETTPAAPERAAAPLFLLSADVRIRLERYVPLGVWVIVVLTLLIIPAKIIGYGYLPMDDALRHAAKAVSGKPWSEILVMRDGFLIDPHPGWHAVLGAIHRLGNCGAETLVVVSIVGLMLLVNFAVLPWLRRPETWLAAMLTAAVCVPRVVTRFTLGRPYLFTIAVFIVLIFLWSRMGDRRPRGRELLSSIVLIALAAWIHGGWYQLGLPLAGLVLAARWRSAIWYGLCWLAGSFLGCALTGHPWQFLFQSVRHLFGVFGDFHLDRQLSSELLPSGGDAPLLFAVAVMLLWRARSPDWKARDLLNPIFMMAVVGWLLGLKMYRFWDDWGLPATMLWLALELQRELENHVAFQSLGRLLATAGLALGVFFVSTSDISSRYTWNLTNEYLTQDNPELSGWLPEKDGVLYSADMRVFNETFFKNPAAPWRYALGFEPGLMRPDDLVVVRKVQWNFGDVRAYEPWIKKMRPEDRLVLRASWLRASGPPNIPELEWRYAVSDLWVGRLRR